MNYFFCHLLCAAQKMAKKVIHEELPFYATMALLKNRSEPI